MVESVFSKIIIPPANWMFKGVYCFQIVHTQGIQLVAELLLLASDTLHTQ